MKQTMTHWKSIIGIDQPVDNRRLAGAKAKKIISGTLLLVILWATVAAIGNRSIAMADAATLLDYIKMEDRQGPLIEFAETGEGVDKELSRENRRFISQNETLLDRIRTELGSDELSWRLMEATQRLMVVPEKHPAYAETFERYCRQVVADVLEQTALPDPYRAIATLETPPTDLLPNSDDGGITAFLVHNIADVYTEEYAFFDTRDRGREVRITLDNRVYLGEIGSYSSFLRIGEGNEFAFEHNRYTLWRNSADDPLNVFIAPIEETLHIALRRATEKAIKTRLTNRPPSSRSDIEAVVEEWLAVEEAVVGGLVRMLLPGILERYLEAESEALDMAKTFAERRVFDKYRFLDRGIAVVRQLGLQSAIRIYRDDARQFKALLTTKQPTAHVPPEDVGA